MCVVCHLRYTFPIPIWVDKSFSTYLIKQMSSFLVVYVTCLSSQVHIPRTNMSWQIYFFLCYKTKKMSSSFVVNVSWLSSQVHLPHANTSWQIYFFLCYKTKQMSSSLVVYVTCLSSQVHLPHQCESSNLPLPTLWNKNKKKFMFCCASKFSIISVTFHHKRSSMNIWVMFS